MWVFFGIAYFLTGIVQFVAVLDGIEYGLHIGRFFSFTITVFITYIPLVGSAIGVYGAINSWHWHLLQAAMLFFWYVPLFALFFVIDAFASRRA